MFLNLGSLLRAAGFLVLAMGLAQLTRPVIPAGMKADGGPPAEDDPVSAPTPSSR